MKKSIGTIRDAFEDYAVEWGVYTSAYDFYSFELQYFFDQLIIKYKMNQLSEKVADLADRMNIIIDFLSLNRES